MHNLWQTTNYFLNYFLIKKRLTTFETTSLNFPAEFLKIPAVAFVFQITFFVFLIRPFIFRQSVLFCISIAILFKVAVLKKRGKTTKKFFILPNFLYKYFYILDIHNNIKTKNVQFIILIKYIE
jgi:hypothetical protein